MARRQVQQRKERVDSGRPEKTKKESWSVVASIGRWSHYCGYSDRSGGAGLPYMDPKVAPVVVG